MSDKKSDKKTDMIGVALTGGMPVNLKDVSKSQSASKVNATPDAN